MAEVKNTGERILLEKETPLMIARHLCAYKFAERFIMGKTVLDIGCGEGYGSDRMAASAASILGLDYEGAVIAFAKEKYRKPNLEYLVLDIKDLGSLNRKFDVICSFQNIEHINDTQKLLGDVSGLLNAGGKFICSTCNIKDASPGRQTPFNKFHVREYTCAEFRKMLEDRFAQVEMWGLHRGLVLKFFRRLKKIGLFNFLPAGLDPVKRFFSLANCGNFYWSDARLEECLDFIAVCSKKEEAF